MKKLACLFFVTFIINGCGNDKIERAAWLETRYFDKYNNQIIDGVPNINFYGTKNVGNYFEFINNENSIKQCNKRIEHIIKNKSDKLSISMAAHDMFLRESGTDEELQNFHSIESMKFRCVVKSLKPSRIGEPQCVSGFIDKFTRKHKPPNYEKLTKKQKKEITELILGEAFMWTDGVNGFGLCQYDVIESKPEIYFIKDILNRSLRYR